VNAAFARTDYVTMVYFEHTVRPKVVSRRYVIALKLGNFTVQYKWFC